MLDGELPDPATAPELFEGILTRRALANLIDLALLIAICGAILLVGFVAGFFTFGVGWISLPIAIPVAILGYYVLTLGSRMRAYTVLFLGWFGPRGLASILFGLLVVEESGVAGADTIFLVMGWTVLLSVLAHGVTAAPLARRYARRIAAHRASRPAMPEVGPATHIRTRTG